VPVTQLDRGNAFRALHQGPRAFIIANAWDAGSARILAGLGFSAIATSSWASANVYGRRDHAITREEALAHARAIAGATDLPVSADLEIGLRRHAERGGRNVPSGGSHRSRRRIDRGFDPRRQGQPAVRHRQCDRARCGRSRRDAQTWISLSADRAPRASSTATPISTM
jgi:hypothetical protein